VSRAYVKAEAASFNDYTAAASPETGKAFGNRLASSPTASDAVAAADISPNTELVEIAPATIAAGRRHSPILAKTAR
jgi:hypothetical protein